MLYGTIYGDIAGSTFEYKFSGSDYNFVKITDKSKYTDDTVMTLAVADWLLYNDRTSENLIKFLQYYGQKYPKAGYGATFCMWLVDKTPKPYNSWGNGSAMRVSPCAWVARSLEESETLAEKSAEVTHNHPEGIKGAKAVASAIFLARDNVSKSTIKEYIINNYGYNLNRTVEEIIESGYEFDVSCQGSVPEAIICFLESNDYEDCIKKAISLGGDTDTQAAIAGSIAEAFYGFPEHLKPIVENKLPNHLLSTLKLFNNDYK